MLIACGWTSAFAEKKGGKALYTFSIGCQPHPTFACPYTDPCLFCKDKTMRKRAQNIYPEVNVSTIDTACHRAVCDSRQPNAFQMQQCVVELRLNCLHTPLDCKGIIWKERNIYLPTLLPPLLFKDESVQTATAPSKQ